MAYGDILAAEETVLLASTYLVGENAGIGANGACLEVRASTCKVAQLSDLVDIQGRMHCQRPSIRVTFCI